MSNTHTEYPYHRTKRLQQVGAAVEHLPVVGVALLQKERHRFREHFPTVICLHFVQKAQQ